MATQPPPVAAEPSAAASGSGAAPRPPPPGEPSAPSRRSIKVILSISNDFIDVFSVQGPNIQAQLKCLPIGANHAGRDGSILLKKFPPAPGIHSPILGVEMISCQCCETLTQWSNITRVSKARALRRLERLVNDPARSTKLGRRPIICERCAHGADWPRSRADTSSANRSITATVWYTLAVHDRGRVIDSGSGHFPIQPGMQPREELEAHVFKWSAEQVRSYLMASSIGEAACSGQSSESDA